MNNKEIISLLRLLEDPDTKVYELVREKILKDSDFFKIYLENYHSFSANNLGLDRSEELLDEMFYLKFEEKLVKYLSASNLSLAEGVFLLETFFNRDVDINQIEAYFDEILRSVWIELNEQLTGIEKVRVISKVLFEQYKLKKYPAGDYNTDYLSITNCLSYKKYVAPTISLLYCMILQNISIPAYPVDIPGLFLLGYFDKELADAVFDEKNNGIVFYFHPYDQGTLINQQIIEKYIKDNKVDIKFSKIKTIPYIDYLIFIFELRVMAIKQKKKNNFCLKYSDKVSTILSDYKKK